LRGKRIIPYIIEEKTINVGSNRELEYAKKFLEGYDFYN
jgi:hypothetical protein